MTSQAFLLCQGQDPRTLTNGMETSQVGAPEDCKPPNSAGHLEPAEVAQPSLIRASTVLDNGATVSPLKAQVLLGSVLTFLPGH